MSCDSATCNQGRNCAGGTDRAPKASRSCYELGVCQARTPACPGCSHEADTTHAHTHHASHDTSTLPPGGFWFGPGLACFDQDEARREPWSWLEISLAAISASGVVGFLAGVATIWWKGLL